MLTLEQATALAQAHAGLGATLQVAGPPNSPLFPAPDSDDAVARPCPQLDAVGSTAFLFWVVRPGVSRVGRGEYVLVNRTTGTAQTVFAGE